MREAEVFVLADRTLNDVIQQIEDDQWAMTMPAGFAMRQTDRVPTLREIVNYHAYDDAWVPDMFAVRRWIKPAATSSMGLARSRSQGRLSQQSWIRRARQRRSWTIPTGSCTAPSVTSARGSTSGRSTASAACEPTISPC